MEKCEICGNERPIGDVDWRAVDTNDPRKGKAHTRCVNTALAKYIADQEAERAKTPALEERVRDEIQSYKDVVRPGYAIGGMVHKIIAMVREHDAAAIKPTTPNDVLQNRVDVLTRELAERTAELGIAREKISAAASALST